MIKIVCISDTHGKHDEITIPPCDILIHSGDATGRGWFKEVRNFAVWFEQQPAKHKIFVPGNHELEFEKELPRSRSWFTEYCPTGTLLIDQAIEFEGIKFYASPITPQFFNWAFMKNRGQDIKRHWDRIPEDTQFLITHGAPKGILDYVPMSDYNAGCEELLFRVAQLKDLKYHVFGHLHAPGGLTQVHNNITFINAAMVGEDYRVGNRKPIEIEYV